MGVAVSIGTPGQVVKVAIDTGSDELWVDPKCSTGDLEPTQQQECEADGTYIASKSTSAKGPQGGADIPYGKGEVEIQYYFDNIGLPGSSANLTNVQFGVANRSTELSEGILGLGYGKGLNLNYNNFVDQLALQKVTNSKAFSVALGSVNANNGGVVIFGGVDTKKFSGSLVSNKILGPQGSEDINRYWIQMTSVALDTSGTSKTYTGGNIPVVLDSGSSLSYLPTSIVSSMASDFQGKLDRQSGLYIVSCSQITKSGSIDFAFGSVTIKVPFSEFIWQADAQTCVLCASPVDPSSGVTALLGDTFLRSAYVVFDQTAGAISMAQYVNCGQAEQSIPASGASGIQGQCSGSSSSSGTNAAGRVGYSSVGLAAALVAGAMIPLL